MAGPGDGKGAAAAAGAGGVRARAPQAGGHPGKEGGPDTGEDWLREQAPEVQPGEAPTPNLSILHPPSSWPGEHPPPPQDSVQVGEVLQSDGLDSKTGEALPSGLYPMGSHESQDFRLCMIQELAYGTVVPVPQSTSLFANSFFGTHLGKMRNRCRKWYG